MKVLDVLETTPSSRAMEANGRVLKDALNALAKEAGLQESHPVHRLSLLVADQVS